jgi:hypothetical protein
MLSPQIVLTAASTARLCDELAWLRARYDGGAVAPTVYSVIKDIEIELAWRLHAQHPDRRKTQPRYAPPRPAPPPPVVRSFASRGPSSALLRAQLRVLADAREGQRNQALFWTACRMGEAVRAGTISEDKAMVLLTSVGRQVGLLDREIVRAARSGIRAGIK